MNINDEIKLIYDIIIHPAGFDVDICGVLCIRRYEQPRWAVELDQGNGSFQIDEYDDPMSAAQKFVEIRRSQELGLDYE